MAVLPRPVMMMIWSQPAARASSTPYWMIGLSTSGSISLGCALVAGRKRVPKPAAGKMAFRTLIIAGIVAELIPALLYNRGTRFHARSHTCPRESAGSAHWSPQPRNGSRQSTGGNCDARGTTAQAHRRVRRTQARAEHVGRRDRESEAAGSRYGADPGAQSPTRAADQTTRYPARLDRASTRGGAARAAEPAARVSAGRRKQRGEPGHPHRGRTTAVRLRTQGA